MLPASNVHKHDVNITGHERCEVYVMEPRLMLNDVDD